MGEADLDSLPRDPHPAPSRLRVRLGAPGLACCVLVLLTLSGFGSVLGNDFVNYDDPAYVAENAHVLSGLSREGLAWAFTTTHTGNWIPLTWLSLMLDAELFGRGPASFHATNLLLHTAAVLLLFGVLNRLTGAVLPSALAAALFAVHPLHVEPVAWVSQRKELLAVCFGIAALGAYGVFATRRRRIWYLGALAAFAASLLSKPIFVTLPLLLLLLDYWPLGRIRGAQRVPWRRLAVEKLPFAALAAAGCLTALWSQSREGAVASFEYLPLGIRLANAVAAAGLYLAKTLWPTGLAVFYPHPGSALSAASVAIAGIALALLSSAALAVSRRHPYALFGWLWYLAALLPVIGLVQIGSQQMADRYTYVPHIGLFVAAAFWLDAWLRRAGRGRAAPLVLAAGVLAALVGATRAQVGHWADSLSLFRHALAVTRDNYLAHTNLAIALHQQGQLYQAIDHYARALAIAPYYHPAHHNRGLALVKLGRYAEAGQHFSAVLLTHPRDAHAHNNLGMTWLNQGRPELAIPHFREAALLEPDSQLARQNLARALAMLGPGG